jgi:hypothetical protein
MKKCLLFACLAFLLSSCAPSKQFLHKTQIRVLTEDVNEVTYDRWDEQGNKYEETGTLKEGWAVVPVPNLKDVIDG